MAEKHPYVTSPGGLVQVISHFRKSFPGSVTADTLRKLGFAPKNESYILNVLRFLGLIDQDGGKTAAASKVFALHEDDAFVEEFSKIVEEKYSALFELHGDGSWTLDTDSLLSFFRATDETTDLVGRRQASTFKLLASFCGHGEVPSPKTAAPRKNATISKPISKGPKRNENSAETSAKVPSMAARREPKPFGLTVRIEINLPADGDQETYDRIFRSIKENLLNE